MAFSLNVFLRDSHADDIDEEEPQLAPVYVWVLNQDGRPLVTGSCYEPTRNTTAELFKVVAKSVNRKLKAAECKI